MDFQVMVGNVFSLPNWRSPAALSIVAAAGLLWRAHEPPRDPRRTLPILVSGFFWFLEINELRGVNSVGMGFENYYPLPAGRPEENQKKPETSSLEEFIRDLL
jgi:hypothetical protein